MAGFGNRSETIRAPDGRIWTVRRALLPRPPRFAGWKRPRSRKRDRSADDADGADRASWDDWRAPDDTKFWRESDRGKDTADTIWAVGDLATAFDDVGAAFLAVAVAAVVLVLAWFLVFPVLIFVVDLLIFLLIAAGGIAIRVLFRRPWKIGAQTDGPPPEQITWGVVGMRTSAEAVKTVADAISRGTPPCQIRPAPGPR